MVNQIQKLVDERAKVWKEIEGLRDDLSGGNFTSEMEEKFDRMEKHYALLDKQVLTLEQKEIEDAYKASQEGQSAFGKGKSEKQEGEIYAEVFDKWIRKGMKNLSDTEAQMLEAGKYMNAAQQTITTTGGGYVIPEGFAAEVVKSMKYYGPFGVTPGGGPARIISTTSGNPFPIPTIDDTSNTGQDLAINADATTGSDALTFGVRQLDAYVITSDVIQVPKQLLQDEGVGFPQLLAELLGERMGRRYNNKVTRGLGVSDVQGFEDVATQGKVTAADDAFTGNELIDLQHSVDAAYRANPSVGWMMHDSIAGYIRKLTVTSNADQYLWEPSFVAGQPSRLLGNPVYINNDLDSTVTADKRTVFFGDWSKFWIRIVRGMELQRFDERFAEKYQVGWMGTMRFDSELVDRAAIKFLRQYNT